MSLRALIFALFARTFVAQAFVIPSGSMVPSLLLGDHVLVNKFVFGGRGQPAMKWLPSREVERGDIVVFQNPRARAEVLIKRCIGRPGDQIELVAKKLRINGSAVAEGGVVQYSDLQVYDRGLGLDPRLVARDNFGPYLVPAGQYFFLGDNRDESDDSRFWGSVPSSQVMGRAALVYWSTERGVGAGPHGVEALRRVRWERFFRPVR